MQHGYSKCIEQLDGAVKLLVRYVCGLDSDEDQRLDDNGAKDGQSPAVCLVAHIRHYRLHPPHHKLSCVLTAIMTRCDDMRDPQIGVLVRRHFCSAVVRLLLIGMYTRYSRACAD
jgi:hypothetical protein